MVKIRRKRRLSKRDRQILLQAKTDMVTLSVVHKRYFATSTIEAARSALRRLCGEPPNHLYLRPEPLDQRQVYYCLTTKATRLLGISPKYAQALKRQGKVKRFAVSWFIHADAPGKRMLFDPRQFPDDFDVRGHRLPSHPFFIDESSDRPKLGFILVDHNAHVRHTARKTVKPLARFLRNGWFDRFIRQDSFIVVVLTFTAYRKRAIEYHLRQAISQQLRYPLSLLRSVPKDRLPIDLWINVVPDLSTLITDNVTEKGKP